MAQNRDLNIILHGEVQLLDWGETRSAGPWIKLRLEDPAHLDLFRGMDTPKLKKSGHIMNITLSQGDIIQEDDPPEPKKGPYGKAVSKLHKSGFFRSPAVWAAMGSDEEYKAWIQLQPCCICGCQDYVEELGEGRCEAAHVLRADATPSREGKNPNKPPYRYVPMCHKHHALQHRAGESEVYREFAFIKQGERPEFSPILIQMAKDWFDKERMKYVELWTHNQMAHRFGVQSLTMLDPNIVMLWAIDEKIDQYLPKDYVGD